MGEFLGLVAELGFSFFGAGLFLAGIVGGFFVLIFFVNGGRYGEAPKLLTPVEAEEARREVGRRLSELAPRTILLAERLRELDEALARGVLEDGLWPRVERLTREAPTEGVWRKYSTASALAGERPLEALEALREVEWMLETAQPKLEEARRLCDVGERA